MEDFSAVTRQVSVPASRFLPGLVEYVFCQKEKPEVPWTHKLKGGLLFVDVRNFTAMTEEVTRRGHYGVEVITRLLNGYYELVYEVVRRHGGEIVKFAGDAFLAVFLGEKQPALEAISRSAFQIRQRLVRLNKRFRSEFGGELSFHGIASWGSFNLILMGDPRWHYDFIFYGEALRRFFAIPLSPEAGLISGLPARIPSTGSTRVKTLRCSSRDAEAGLAFLPPAIRDLIVFRHFSAELRNVAILFIHLDVRGLRGGSHLKNLQQAFCHIQQCVYRYEGIVNKVDFNEKGLVILCSFGIPVAHLNDIERAIIAARSILDYTHRGVFRIGCTYSNIYAGILGSSKRYEYGIIGSAVNAASRLMQEAEMGQILISDTMLAAVEVRFRCLYLKETTVKGFADPVKIYQIVSELPVSYHSLSRLYADQQMVAWHRELEEITSTISTSGEALRLFVSGEPGVGKTFLLWNLLNRLQDSRSRVAMLSLDEYNQAETYHLIYALLRDHFNSENALSSETELSLLVKKEDPDLNPGLICKYFNSRDILYQTDADRNLYQEIIFDQIQRLLQALLNEIDVLVIDNLHWLDRMSLRLLGNLPSGLQTHLVFTARYGMHGEHFPHYRRLELSNLDPVCSRNLITSQIGLIAEDAIDHLFRLTGGNPLFLIELCREINAMHKHRKRLITLADLVALERRGNLPHSIENLFVNRLAFFNTETQYLLKLAAIVGKAFTLDEITVIGSEKIREKVLELLVSLDQSKLISRVTITPEIVYIFSNNLMREAIYNTILLSEKRGLHRKIAAHYEESLSGEDSSNLEIIANHYILAEDAEKALDFCIRAARKNYALANYEESSYYFSTALRFCTSPRQITPLQLDLVDSQFYHAELEAANRLLERMEAPGPNTPLFSQYIYLKAKALYLQGSFAALADLVIAHMAELHLDHHYYLCLIFYADALRTMNKAAELKTLLSMLSSNINLQLRMLSPLPLSYISGDLAALIHTLESLALSPELREPLYYICKLEGIQGQLCFDQGNYRRSARHFRQVLALSQMLGDDIATRVALNSLGNILLQWGRHQAALKYYQKAKKLAEKCGDRYGYLKVIMDIGVLHRQQGQFDVALQAYQTSYDMALIMGNKSQQENSLYNIGEIQFQQNKLDEAEQSMTRALQLALEISDSVGVSYASDALGDIAQNRGDIDGAEKVYRQNLEYQTRINDRKGIAHSLGNLGNIAAAREDYPTALDYYRQNQQICHEIGDFDGEGRAHFNAAMSHLSLNDAQTALDKLQAAQTCFRRANINIYDELVDTKITECRELLSST